MKLSNAINKLKKNGWAVDVSNGQLVGSRGGAWVQCSISPDETCSKFTYNSESSCAPTYGLSLAQAIN